MVKIILHQRRYLWNLLSSRFSLHSFCDTVLQNLFQALQFILSTKALFKLSAIYSRATQILWDVGWCENVHKDIHRNLKFEAASLFHPHTFSMICNGNFIKKSQEHQTTFLNTGRQLHMLRKQKYAFNGRSTWGRTKLIMIAAGKDTLKKMEVERYFWTCKLELM